MNTNNNSILTIKEFFDRHQGLQRNNRYSITFRKLPAGIPKIQDGDFHPLVVQMGARAIDSMADNLAGYGPGRSVPRSPKFVPGVMMAFPVTNDNMITDFYDAWFNKIYSGGRQQGNYATPFQLSYYDDIILNTQMDVNLLDPNGNINRTMTFYEVYPLETLPMQLTMMDQNNFLTYQVIMMFRDFTFKKSNN